MRYTLHLILLLLTTTPLCAQEDAEYRMEIGTGVGVVSYQGDANGSILKSMQPMASVIWRYVFNPYMALRVMGEYGKLKGSTGNVTTTYPDWMNDNYYFNKQLGDINIAFEYNFLPYGTGSDYRGAKRLTPFVFGGIGGTYVADKQKKVLTGNLPLGLGIKYKVGSRLNVGLEWAIHFTLSDKLDGLKDPYHIKSIGLFKNTDSYSALQVMLSYSFQAKCRTCYNDSKR